MHRPQPAIVFVCFVAIAIATTTSAQSLADAAKKAQEVHAAAAADKAPTDDKKADATKPAVKTTYTNKDLKDSSPSPIQTSTASLSPDVATAAADATTSAEPSSIAANRIAAAALLDNRLVALSAAMAERDQTAARYQDACEGKATSAGWLLKGQLIMTPNAETPACRTMASDLARQTSAYAAEHAAIEETARTSRILPGVLRDILAAHHIPE